MLSPVVRRDIPFFILLASLLSAPANAAYNDDANDRLTTDTYDANGNTLVGRESTRALVSDAYDFEDRLITRVATLNSQPTTINIQYDGDGNRVAKTVGGVTTLFLVDDRNPTGYAQVLEELVTINNQPPTLNRVYAYGNDLISQEQLLDDGNGGFVWVVSFYGYDGHGSVRYLTDAAGNVTDTYDYDAYGTMISQTPVAGSQTPNSYLYCGEQFDQDLGLYYNRARYLNTDSGRFWTRDVFEGLNQDPISLHKYLYAHADPVNNIDPSGQVTMAVIGQGLLITYRGVSMGATIGFAAIGVYQGISYVACLLRQNEINRIARVELEPEEFQKWLRTQTGSQCTPLLNGAAGDVAKGVLFFVTRPLSARPSRSSVYTDSIEGKKAKYENICSDKAGYWHIHCRGTALGDL